MKYASVIAACMLLGTQPLLASPGGGEAHTDSSGQDKVICKRIVDTGSLVKGRKVCKTRAVWQQEAELSRRDARQQLDQGLINSERGR